MSKDIPNLIQTWQGRKDLLADIYEEKEGPYYATPVNGHGLFQWVLPSWDLKIVGTKEFEIFFRDDPNLTLPDRFAEVSDYVVDNYKTYDTPHKKHFMKKLLHACWLFTENHPETRSFEDAILPAMDRILTCPERTRFFIGHKAPLTDRTIHKIIINHAFDPAFLMFIFRKNSWSDKHCQHIFLRLSRLLSTEYRKEILEALCDMAYNASNASFLRLASKTLFKVYKEIPSNKWKNAVQNLYHGALFCDGRFQNQLADITLKSGKLRVYGTLWPSNHRAQVKVIDAFIKDMTLNKDDLYFMSGDGLSIKSWNTLIDSGNTKWVERGVSYRRKNSYIPIEVMDKALGAMDMSDIDKDTLINFLMKQKQITPKYQAMLDSYLEIERFMEG